MNTFRKISIVLSLGFAALGVASQAQASIADEIVCTADDLQELMETVNEENLRPTGAIFNHTSWNNYFAAYQRKYGKEFARRKALTLFACVRNVLIGLDGEIRAETDPERQRELTFRRNQLSVVYVEMGRAIAPNVRLPRTR